MSNKEEVSVCGILNLEEFKKYNTYHIKTLKIGFFFTSLIIFFFLFLLFRVIDAFWFMELWFALAFSLIPSSVILVFINMVTRNRAIREYKSDQLIKNEIKYVFREDGINQKIRRSNNYYEWTDIVAIYEHQDMFLLYVSKNKAIVLPKRFFEENEQKELFKKIVSKNAMTQKIKWL